MHDTIKHIIKMNNGTYGIIFCRFAYGKLYLYLKKNTMDYHEDFIISDKNMIDELKKISALYKSINHEINHVTFILSRNKYNDLFENYMRGKNVEKIDFNKFNSIPFTKTLKHRRLKTNDLTKSLGTIRSNYIMRRLLQE